jgi:hypothetical protein
MVVISDYKWYFVIFLLKNYLPGFRLLLLILYQQFLPLWGAPISAQTLHCPEFAVLHIKLH